jgi:hypothetical protein
MTATANIRIGWSVIGSAPIVGNHGWDMELGNTVLCLILYHLPWLTFLSEFYGTQPRFTSFIEYRIKAVQISAYNASLPHSKYFRKACEPIRFSLIKMPDNTTLAQNISELKTTYATITARLEGSSHSSLSALEDLKKFASNLQRKCNNTVHLNDFHPLATDIKNAIFQHVRDTADSAKLHAQIASFRNFYTDKDNWLREHSSVDGWQEYLNSLEYSDHERPELLRLTHGFRWVTELEKLWCEVQLEDAKAQHRAHKDEVSVQ